MNTDFKKNRCERNSGGALYFNRNKIISMTRCAFEENCSQIGSGGAIYFNVNIINWK